LACANLVNLEKTVLELESSGTDMLHLDIEDGSFVPLLTLGTKIISDLRPLTSLPFDVHLMVNEPEFLIPDIASSGANLISFHHEACKYPRRLLRIIKDYGIKAGIAFNPKTAISELEYLKPYIDFILLLSSEPEHKDPDFLSQTLKKVSMVRNMLPDPEIDIAMDGGININNIDDVIKSGVNVFIIGRGIFSSADFDERIRFFQNKFSLYL